MGVKYISSSGGSFQSKLLSIFFDVSGDRWKKKSTSIDFASDGILTLPFLISGQSYEHSINNVNYDSRVVILDCRLATDSCKRHGLAKTDLSFNQIALILFWSRSLLYFCLNFQ